MNRDVISDLAFALRSARHLVPGLDRSTSANCFNNTCRRCNALTRYYEEVKRETGQDISDGWLDVGHQQA